MAQKRKTPLATRFGQLPRDVKYLPAIIKAGISERTFHYDKKRNPNSIPHERLEIYAGLLDCAIDDLINSYSKLKVNPIIKRPSLAKSVGLKN